MVLRAMTSTRMKVVALLYAAAACFLTSWSVGSTPIALVHVDRNAPLTVVEPRYLSFALDLGIEPYSLSSPDLRTMIAHLGPAYLRVGGSPADQGIFTDLPASFYADLKFSYQPLKVIAPKTIDDLMSLVKEANLRLLFNLNLQLRFGPDWSPLNFVDFLRYCEAKGYGPLIDVELGNEPDAYKKGQGHFTGDQIAKDLNNFNKVLRKFKSFSNSSVVGPDTSGVDKPIISEVIDGAGQVLHALTFHQYYFKGSNSSPIAPFLDLSNYDLLKGSINEVKSLISGSRFPKLRMWLGETSDCWNTGSPNASDRFVSGFLWLDKLGLAAKMGVSVVIRQTLFGGNYGLIGMDNAPNPDYWLTLLHRNIVGPIVLDTALERNEEGLRLYAHCARRDRYPAGAVVVFGINLAQSTTFISFNQSLPDQPIDKFILLPTEKGNLRSRRVSLNGYELKLMKGRLPRFKPQTQDSSVPVLLSPLSLSFFVFPEADFAICR